ncbi:MAG: hypothetical protein II041_00445, partial [Bacteroidales bacterium]|nr:hypothetical protein [Bacteroidales bacterium]
MESRLGILSAESHIYKEQHAKGLELLALMEEDFLGRHPSRITTPAGRPEYADCPIDFNISHTKVSLNTGFFSGVCFGRSSYSVTAAVIS